jgi:hypothetical protein
MAFSFGITTLATLRGGCTTCGFGGVNAGSHANA